MLKANRSKCSVHYQSSIVGCVGVQVGDFLIVENTQKSQNRIGGCVGVQMGEFLWRKHTNVIAVRALKTALWVVCVGRKLVTFCC